jgi:signal recognition particle subunit SRP54
MGDVVSFVERVQETVDADEAERAAQRLMENRFTLEDFRTQLSQIKKMGPIGQLVGMLPGAGQMASAAQAAVDSGQMAKIEAIIDSMTPDERRRPQIIKASRRRRIAMGSGTTPAEVNRLLRQFAEMQKMMKMVSGGKLPKAGGGLGALLGR